MRPNDERGFIHKKIIRGIGKVASVASAVGIPGASFVSRAARTLAPRTTTARVNERSIAQTQFGLQTKFASEPSQFPIQAFHETRPRPNGGQRAPCDFPMVRDRDGRCRKPTSGEFGGEQFGVGEAVMGRYGAALEPGSMIVDRAVCLKGMQLADDGLCYNKSQISNKQRMWPAGRKPLLSGGDMRAISTAARAGRRLEGATKRLQRLGMMKKPTPRRVGGRASSLVLGQDGHAHIAK